MAISLKASGSWAELQADGSVTIPGSPAAGDRMFLFASWKTYTITASVSGWTPIGSEYADGTTAAGNGSGSMKVQAWYRDWQSGDGNPTIDFSANPTEAAVVIEVWQKGAGESWDTPITDNVAWPLQDGGAATTAADVVVPSGSVVFGLIGIRDDSATFTRSATAALDYFNSSTLVWNGNYVESPATHASYTTGQDMAADLGHRFVTTGATDGQLRLAISTAGLGANETGAIKFVVQGVSASGTNANAGVAEGTGTADF